MAPSLSESRAPHRLSALLDDVPWPADAALRLIHSLACQIHGWHEGGRIHGAITADAVTLAEGSEPVVEPPAAACPSFGGQYGDLEICPPFLAGDEVLEVPQAIPAAEALFRQRKISSDPRQIDLYQLGTLLCRLVTGKSALVYMYDPRAKAGLPRVVQQLLERLLASEPGSGFSACGQLAEAIDEALRSLPAEVPAAGLHRAAAADGETPARGSVLRAMADDTPARGYRPAGSSAGMASPDQGGDLPFRRLGIYTIISRIGGGGMGDVYLARDESLDRPVALKVLPADLARDKEFVQRFRAEAAAAAKVVHPNVVPIYSIDEDAGHHFFSMHYVEGESLAARLSRRKRLPPDEAVEVVRQCLAGLGAAHAVGLIHRDVKPGNILIERSSGRVLLVDFGLVRRLGENARMTATGVIMGTVDYIAPEQARGKQVDGRTDLYSLGVMFYQMLSGGLPFEAETPTAMIFQHAYEAPPPLAQRAPQTPAALVSIIARLMAKDPADRYQDAQSVLADLDRFASGKAEPAGAVAAGQASQKPPEDARGAGAAAPPLFAEPSQVALPEQLHVSRTPRAWRSIQDWAATMFRRYSPQVLQDLQSTTQQVDAAVAEYERRRERLARLEQEARSVVADLSQQMEENRRAASLAEAKADSAADEAERREALDQKDACRQRVDAMAGQLELDKEQLDDIESQLSRADATLAQLRSQRDLLKARWKALEARAVSVQERPQASRRRRRIAFWAAVGACCIGAAVLVMHVKAPRPDVAGVIAPSVETPDTKPAAPAPDKSIDASPPGQVDPGSEPRLSEESSEKLSPLESTAGLRYRFRPNERYVYETRIEADLPSSKQTTSGQVTYTVTSVDVEAGYMTLSATGSLNTTSRPKPIGHGPPYYPSAYPHPPLPFETSYSDDYGYARQVTIDSSGKVLKYEGGNSLPYVLGPIALLMIDPLPPDGEKSWSADGSVDLLKKQNEPPYYRPPMFHRPNSQTRWTSRQIADYTLAGADGDLAVISKKYRLVTDQQTDGKPLLEQVGHGEIRFDTKAGVPTSLEMEYSITVHDEGVTIGVSTTLTTRLLSKAEVEEIQRKKEEALAAAKEKAAEAARPKPIDDAELDQVLADIASGDDKKVQSAVKRLSLAIPIESRRREVATALQGVLEKEIRNTAINAVKGLGVWGSVENAPAIAKVLEPGSHGGRDYWLRQAAIVVLAKFPTPETAAAVAGQLRNGLGREDAVKALQQMGPVAEDAVLPILDASDIFTRAAACRVLVEVGTAKSLEPLKKLLLSGSNGLVNDQARKAIAAIEARK